MPRTNTALISAKIAKNDEFYTKLADIETEIGAYLAYDPDLLKNKTVLCPCDDPWQSQFAQYFMRNFDVLGLKKLIVTSRAPMREPQMTIFDLDHEYSDADVRGKGLIWQRQEGGAIEKNAGFLNGSGDYRSTEVSALRDEADFIITNIPFSCASKFIIWAHGNGRKLALITSINAVADRDTFPLIQREELWCGASRPTEFITPDGNIAHIGNACWLTNLPFARTYPVQSVHTMAYNLAMNEKLKRCLIRTYGQHPDVLHYQRYSTLDAIDVPYTDCVPCDYDGLMGVPVSWLLAHTPGDGYEIVGLSTNITASSLGIAPLGKEWLRAYRAAGGTGHYTAYMRGLGIITDDGRALSVYKRLIIRRKGAEKL